LVCAEGLSGHVTFTGRLTPESVAAELRRAAVWVSIPPSDSFALSLQEAMACGTFPVVADLPAMREGLDESRSILVPDVTVASVAQALLEGVERSTVGSHVAPNRRFVEEHGDRRINLARFESLLMSAVTAPHAARGDKGVHR
jgi:glycosyltransferase involved in cell wall biosynthesis